VTARGPNKQVGWNGEKEGKRSKYIKKGKKEEKASTPSPEDAFYESFQVVDKGVTCLSIL